MRPLLRERLFALVFLLCQIPAVFVAGIARPVSAPGFDFVSYGYLGLALPIVLGGLILLIGWVLNPTPRRYY